MKKPLSAIPTNIITGFLGVGKTSAILHLLDQKPANETWAVLVNEYGSLGIDADILSDKDAYIEQVPGGCICCAQGLPFEVALNRLIKNAKPNRLIIEPSGLAHPYRIISQLSSGYFQTLLKLMSTVCLVDPRNFSDERYLRNEMFVDQIALSDVLIANKIDLSNEQDLKKFRDYINRVELEKSLIIEIQQGKFDLTCLNYERNRQRKPSFPDSHTSQIKQEKLLTWSKVYSKDVIFNLENLVQYFKSQAFVRLKAIIKTDKGWFVFNQIDRQLTYYETKMKSESRIEVLGRNKPLTLEKYQN